MAVGKDSTLTATSHLRVSPRLAVLAAELPIRLVVADHPLLLAVPAVLPVEGERVELEHRDLVVRPVGGLLLAVVDGRSGDGPASRREDLPWPLFLRPPEDLVHPVNAPVAELAVAVVQEVAEALGVN